MKVKKITNIGPLDFFSNIGFCKITEDRELSFFVPSSSYVPTDKTEAAVNLSSIKDLASIRSCAFANCEFENVISLGSAKIIGDGAFINCKNLKSVVLPTCLVSIGQAAFMGCVSLESIEIPGGVKSIEWRTFYGCSSLKEAVLEDGVSYIGYEAFCGTALEEIKIPQSVSLIDFTAFDDVGELSGVEVAEGNGCFKSIDGDLYTSDGKTLLCAKRTVTSFEFPEGVTSIGNHAFFGSAALREIHIPDSVTSIGDKAFAGCVSLDVCEMPSDIHIGACAFDGCPFLKKQTP